MHLEILIDQARSHIIEKFYIVYSYVTEIALLKMDSIEQKQFKEAVIKQLNRQEGEEDQKESALAKKLQDSKPRFDSIGVMCDIITE